MSFVSSVTKTGFVRSVMSFSVVAILVTVLPARAQDDEIGIAPVSVGAGPYYFDTAEQHDIRVDILARGLLHTYSLAFLPNADALLVERGARLRLIRNITQAQPELVEQSVAGIPDVSHYENATPDDLLGIQDVAVHPDFSKNHLVYYTFNRPVRFDPTSKHLYASAVLVRARLEGMQLVDAQDLIVGKPVPETGGSRIAFGKGNLIYVSVGNTTHSDNEGAQRTDTIYGKVLRVRDDGGIPKDNPFIKVPGARGEIYSLGHRDALGVAIDPRSGSLIVSEHGPQGGDEINRILSGRNYGWPNYTYGTDYEGAPLLKTPVGPGIESPLMIWAPTIAPSGITFYDADKIPAWKHNLFVASARRGQIDRTGALLRIVVNDNLQEVRQESLLESLHQRIRDVRQGPDGLLYALTDEDDSVLMRISPAPVQSHTSAF